MIQSPLTKSPCSASFSSSFYFLPWEFYLLLFCYLLHLWAWLSCRNLIYFFTLRSKWLVWSNVSPSRMIFFPHFVKPGTKIYLWHKKRQMQQTDWDECFGWEVGMKETWGHNSMKELFLYPSANLRYLCFLHIHPQSYIVLSRTEVSWLCMSLQSGGQILCRQLVLHFSKIYKIVLLPDCHFIYRSNIFLQLRRGRVKTVVFIQSLCPTLCNPMDCSTPGFPVLH